jgi:hypothetical protein
MTQQIVKTVDRIRGLIRANLHGEFYSLETAYPSVDRLSETLAAEIDGLHADAATQAFRMGQAMGEAMRESRAEIDALKAEVARLTPLAKAWDRMVNFRMEDRNWMNTPERVIEAFEEFQEAEAALARQVST